MKIPNKQLDRLELAILLLHKYEPVILEDSDPDEYYEIIQILDNFLDFIYKENLNES